MIITNDNTTAQVQYIITHTNNTKNFPKEYSDCLHDSCSNCNGKGFDSFGRACVHNLSCQCKKCNSWSIY